MYQSIMIKIKSDYTMNPDFFPIKEILNPTGSDRLRLLDDSDEDESDESHSLCWESHTLKGWQIKALLTGEQF